MSYETTVSTSVQVKDGPPVTAQKLELKEDDVVASAASQRSELELKNGEESASTEITIPSEGDLAFLAISADKYMYKDCEGIEQPGLKFSPNAACRTPVWAPIRGPIVYVALPHSPIPNLKRLKFVAKKDLFDRTKVPVPKFKVTVTYGVKKKQTVATPPAPCPAPAAAPMQSAAPPVDAAP